jgi:hypothetical protein
MELRTFVKTALLDIVGGITDAQNETEEGTIVPGGINKNYKSVKHGVSELQGVDFEVCVTAEESKGTEGKLGVVSSIVGAGVAGKSSNEQTQSSSLKFRVPIQLPTSGTLRDS